MQFFVVAVSLVAAISGAVAAPSPAVPVIPADASIQKRDWCWDDGFNKGWSARWQLCAEGKTNVGPVPQGATDGCSYNGEPVQSFKDGYQYAVDLKRNCDF